MKLEGLELLESLVGRCIDAVAEVERDDEFYLRVGGRVIGIWALGTNVSTGVPLIRELTSSDIRKLPKSLKAVLGIKEV